MVYFNCDVCGESLKKSQVQKHRFKCRSCHVLSCVDCGKDFRGDDYEQHTKCISEEEKYSGKNYKPKANANKGDVKQELWTQQVQRAIDRCKADPKLQELLELLRSYTNIPRKQAKFQNFLSNSLRIHNAGLVAKAWEAISAEMVPENAETDKPVEIGNQSTNGTCRIETADNATSPEACIKQKAKKRKKEKAVTVDKEEEKTFADVKVDSSAEVNVEKKKKKRRSSKQLSAEAKNNDDSVSSTIKDSAALPEPTEHSANKKKKKKKHRRKGDVNEVGDISKLSAENGLNMTDSAGTEQQQPSTTDITPDEKLDGGAGDAGSHKSHKFKWHVAIVAALQKAPERQLSVKKLRKKVLKDFKLQSGDEGSYSKEKQLSKLMRKLDSCAQVKVHDSLVSLTS